MYKLTFVQTFYSVRTFLSLYYERTKLDKMGVLMSALSLWNYGPGWKENPVTFGEIAWAEWIEGVKLAMKEAGINSDYEKLIYDEELAFLCLKSYLQSIFDEYEWEDIKEVLDQLNNAKHVESDFVWQEWLQSIKHVKNGTYELDVYCDPFTFERM